MTMGDRIHTLRKDKGLTLEDIGRAAGVAKSTVRKWESGSITSIRTDKVQKVAAALDTTLEYLLNGVESSGALYKNMEPLPQTRPVPVIGNIACGMPILFRHPSQSWERPEPHSTILPLPNPLTVLRLPMLNYCRRLRLRHLPQLHRPHPAERRRSRRVW